MAPALVRCSGAPYALTFLLPDGLSAFVSAGTHQPCLAGCLLVIHRGGLVTVTGNERKGVFEQTDRFFRIIARDRPAFFVSARLRIPGGRVEAWEIAINSKVTFTRDFAPVIAAEVENIRGRDGKEG